MTMATPAELRAQLDQLRATRAGGVREVQNGDERIAYQSGRDLDVAP